MRIASGANGMRTGKILLIVESPAKAKTIGKYLSKQYDVISTKGHLLDLPKSRLAVNIEDKSFAPDYVTVRGKASVVNEIRKKSAKADLVLLASDNDREGEAISWSVFNLVTKNSSAEENIPRIARIRFNEITKKSIQKSIQNPEDLDFHKINAQKMRRVLDRIVGYYLSPILWKKVCKGLSAGRVQSATLKLICDRDQEIQEFESKEYWSISGLFTGDIQHDVPMDLVLRDNVKFTPESEQETKSCVKMLTTLTYKLSKFSESFSSRKPYPPYITSTLQQDMVKEFGYSPNKTMSLAQRLYEGVDIGNEILGLITYTRTDSPRISKDAIQDVRTYVQDIFGSEYLPKTPKQYASARRNQDAHECIRPTKVSLTPEVLKKKLKPDELNLYRMVWSRFVACQMVPAKYAQRMAEIVSVIQKPGDVIWTFRWHCSKRVFWGCMKVYPLHKAIGEDQEWNRLEGLAEVVIGSSWKLIETNMEQHFTKPPGKFNAASLIKEMEKTGVGRPSTYAPTLQILLKRHYVALNKQTISSTRLGQITNQLMTKYFPDIVNVDFTAHMEDLLDKVEEDKQDWVNALNAFYVDFKDKVDVAKDDKVSMKKELEETLDEKCEKCEESMVKKYGQHGYFLACSAFPGCRNTKPIGLGGCPTCGEGDIVQRISKKKRRTFFGCSRFPKCNFVSWEGPDPDKRECPNCNRILFAKAMKSKVKYICKHEECGCHFEEDLSSKKTKTSTSSSSSGTRLECNDSMVEQ